MVLLFGQRRGLGPTCLGASKWPLQQCDHNRYYDHDGRDHRIRCYGQPPPPLGAPPPPNYYQPGAYAENCYRGDAVNGTIFGMIADELLGGLASHGKSDATVGGVVANSLLANVIGRDEDCVGEAWLCEITPIACTMNSASPTIGTIAATTEPSFRCENSAAAIRCVVISQKQASVAGKASPDPARLVARSAPPISGLIDSLTWLRHALGQWHFLLSFSQPTKLSGQSCLRRSG